jgi:hypothetical protein
MAPSVNVILLKELSFSKKPVKKYFSLLIQKNLKKQLFIACYRQKIVNLQVYKKQLKTVLKISRK